MGSSTRSSFGSNRRSSPLSNLGASLASIQEQDAMTSVRKELKKTYDKFLYQAWDNKKFEIYDQVSNRSFGIIINGLLRDEIKRKMQ
jgi:hypothetical protein